MTTVDGARPRGTRAYRRAVGWSFALNLGQEAATFLVTLVLAGLLGPEAYGVVALAATYLLLLQMGLQAIIPALVQRPTLDDVDKDTAFWMTLGASLAFWTVSVALAGWWAEVNGIPQLRSVIIALSALVVVKGLVVVQEALLRRSMDFRALAIRTNVSVVVGGAMGIGLALAGYGVWSLVGQQLTTGVVELAVLWGITSWRPRRRFCASSARGLARFAAASTVGSVGVFVNNRSDVLLIGLFFGAAAVGLYRLASRIVESVANLLMVSLQAVALPELSRFQDDDEQFAARVVTIVRTGALLGLPVLGVVAASSEPAMRLLGERWAPAAAVLQVLCVVAGVRAITAFSGPMLQARGRPGLGAVLAWIAGGLSALTFVLTGLALQGYDTADQVLLMAVSRAVLFGGVFLAINVWLMRRYGGVTLAAVVGAVVPSAVAGLAAASAGWVLRHALGLDRWPALADLVATALLSGAVGVAVLLTTDREARALLGRLRTTLLTRTVGPRRPMATVAEPAIEPSRTAGPA